MAQRKITKEKEKEAIRIAMAGGDPLTFLEENGIGNPTQKWYAIKETVKATDPDTYAQLPNRIQRKAKVETPEGTLASAMTGMKNATEEFFGKCKDMGLKIETPEKPKINKPVNYDGMTVKAVSGDFGTYYLDNQTRSGVTYLDYSNKSGDELSMEINQWRSFLKELKHAGEILGVTL